MFEYINDVCGFLPVCNKGCVRQSSFIHSLSIENITGMPYLKIRILSTVVLYSQCVWVQGHVLLASSTC